MIETEPWGDRRLGLGMVYQGVDGCAGAIVSQNAIVFLFAASNIFVIG